MFDREDFGLDGQVSVVISSAEACFKRRTSHACAERIKNNIDNQLKCLIIYCF